MMIDGNSGRYGNEDNDHDNDEYDDRVQHLTSDIRESGICSMSSRFAKLSFQITMARR